MFGVSDSLPESVFHILEAFICSVYSSKSACVTLPELRWELFKMKNLEGEKLSKSRGTLKPHIHRANFMSMRDKSYKEPVPKEFNPESNGWEISDGKLHPVYSLEQPAPHAVLELVRCGCKGSCKV